MYSCVGDALSPLLNLPEFLLAPDLGARSRGKKPQIDISISH